MSTPQAETIADDFEVIFLRVLEMLQANSSGLVSQTDAVSKAADIAGDLLSQAFLSDAIRYSGS